MSRKYEKSPYKDSGIGAWARPAKEPTVDHERGLFSGSNDKRVPKDRHYYEPAKTREVVESASQACRFCGRPRFASGGGKCPKRKNRP